MIRGLREKGRRAKRGTVMKQSSVGCNETLYVNNGSNNEAVRVLLMEHGLLGPKRSSRSGRGDADSLQCGGTAAMVPRTSRCGAWLIYSPVLAERE
jgi:hypothetical protein